MRHGARWDDIRIVDVSSRGLCLQGSPPPRGTYVELCRGSHRIVARVVWSSQHRFGVQAQDRVPVDALVGNPDEAVEKTATTSAPVERRATPRHAERADRSRFLARSLQFTALALFATTAATSLHSLVSSALAAPMVAIGASLAGPQ
jgi:hypothetical protein